MNVSDMLTEIGNHGFADLTSANLLYSINDTYYEVCTREPWPFMEALTPTLTISGTTGLISVPSDINAVLTFVDLTNQTKLQPERYQYLTRNFGDLTSTGTTGKPSFYYTIGANRYVYPPPAGTYSYNLHYIKNPNVLTSSTAEAAILLPPAHHRVIVLGALAKLYAMDDDIQIADNFRTQFEAKLQWMREDLWMLQYDRGERVYDSQDMDELD